MALSPEDIYTLDRVPTKDGQIYVASDESVYIGKKKNWLKVTGSQYYKGDFNKDTIPGLVSWYKADDGPSPTTEGTNITSWLDKSDTGNSLTTVVGTRGYYSNVQNGLPGIYFVASSYIQGANLADIAYPYTEFAVFTPTSWGTGGYQAVVNLGAAAGVIYKNTGTTNILFTNQSGVNLVGGDAGGNTTKLITAVANSTASSVAINDQVATIGNAGANANTNFPLIGANGVGAEGYTGYFHEWLVFTGALTDAQKAVVQNYLNTKWNIY